MEQFLRAAAAAGAAAEEGKEETLREWLENQDYLGKLQNLAAKPFVHTPLHDACASNHLILVKELLTLFPKLAKKKNESGLSPLHFAAKEGHVEIVKELLKGRQHLCLLKGPDNKIPLHHAIEKGKVEVMEELISVSRKSVEETTAQRETGLHLAVKENKYEAFVALVNHLTPQNREQVINWKDHIGNTALHLAVKEKNFQVVKFMSEKHAEWSGAVYVNARNNYGRTPLDFVGWEAPCTNTRHILYALGAIHGGDSRTDIRNALLVVAGLIASATYQSVLQPPDFKTKVDKTLTEGFRASYVSYMTGFFGRDLAYIVFITGNTFGLLVSVQMIICLTRDLRIRLPMLLSMTLMVQTYYCHTYYLLFGEEGKEFGLINAELLSVLPLMIPILLLLFQRRLALAIEFYLEKLSLFDHLRDMYYL